MEFILYLLPLVLLFALCSKDESSGDDRNQNIELIYQEAQSYLVL